MPLAIRLATAADAAIITEFNYRLAEESEGVTLDRAVLTRGITACLADPMKGLYFLAEENGVAVGQTGVTFEFSDWRNGWFWWIQSVYVRPEARRRGVFRPLYQYGYQAAQAEPGVIGLRLYVKKDNDRAKKTYEQLGMSEEGYILMYRWPL